MSDPISLVKSILSSFDTDSTSTSSAGSAAPSSASTAASSATPDYALSASLETILKQGTSTGLKGSALATYNVQALMAQSQSSLLSALPADTSGEAAFFNQLSLYQQYLTSVRTGTTAQSATSTDTLDTLLSVTKTISTDA